MVRDAAPIPLLAWVPLLFFYFTQLRRGGGNNERHTREHLRMAFVIAIRRGDVGLDVVMIFKKCTSMFSPSTCNVSPTYWGLYSGLKKGGKYHLNRQEHQTKQYGIIPSYLANQPNPSASAAARSFRNCSRTYLPSYSCRTYNFPLAHRQVPPVSDSQ